MENLKFKLELERLINSHSMENGSDTPDFILADFLGTCLEAFDKAVQSREQWYGRNDENVNKRLQRIADEMNYNNICARATLFPDKEISEIPLVTAEDLKGYYGTRKNELLPKL